MPTYDYQPDDILRLAQDYKVERLLGAGGMASTWLARHCELYRKFAVKIMHASFWDRPDLIAMFGAEARTVARLGEPEPHPGIVEVVYLGRAKDRGRMPYMVMPYLHGETLHQTFARRGPLPVPEAIGIVTRLLQVLDHAHERGVVHRDVKPHNLFLANTGEGISLKVLDWGISKLLAKADDPSVFLGTPAYASREQLLRTGVGSASDIYSAGVVLFRIVTGRLPFHEYGDTFADMLRSVDVPAPSIARYGDFPPTLDDLLTFMLAKNDAERPSAIACAEVLQRVGREVEKRRDPHTHVTAKVEALPHDHPRLAKPEPITEIGIAERTVEDPAGIAAMRASLHRGGASLAGAYADEGLAPASSNAPERSEEITGFEPTSERRPPSITSRSRCRIVRAFTIR